MKYFLKMVEIASNGGVTVPGVEEYSHRDDIGLTDKAVKLIESCQPVVFSQKNTEPIALKDSDLHAKLDSLDAPFPVFSYEMSEGPICSPEYMAEARAYIWCAMVIETAPKRFITWALVSEGDSYIVMITTALDGITKKFLDRLNEESVGYENTRTVVKIGKGSVKKQHRVRRVVHVMPKKYQSSYSESSGRHIEFSHRFMVRGHWRRLVGTGKDRSGDYCVSGYTWVTEFEKGPEKAPLIVKTRIVE